MSYILDALRKADQQRRLGAVPTLASAAAMSVPSEVPSIVVRRLLGVILIMVIATAIIWLRPSIMEKITAASGTATPMPPDPPPALVHAAAARADAPAMAPLTMVAEVVAVAESGKGIPQPAEAEMPRRKAPAAVSKPGPEPKGLPVMVVAVHAYSSRPEDRLVSINGQLLKEGDTLAPGLLLEQITPDGMIFDFRGKRIQRKAR